MIEYIEVKNFKSIKDKYFPLKNLNVLLGLNGQGKSSFIQSLLVLRQSDNIDVGELKLGGGKDALVNIGTSSDALYQYSQDQEISFKLKFVVSGSLDLSFKHQPNSDILKAIKNDSEVRFFTHYNESLFSNNFQYLNAQRKEPKSINDASYSKVVHENSIGKYGQFTAHYLELRGTDEIAFENLIHPNSIVKDAITNTEIVNKQLLNQVNLWLREISPDVSVSTFPVSSDIIKLEYEFEQPNRGRTNKFKPENVGFGISYALHVVTALLSARPGGLIIIENPESHIHPRGQAELGKLISLVAQNDVQIVIETHSDHILNGIRVGVKEEPTLKDKVILFYFKKIVEEFEQYTSVINIKIDRNGTLSDYPDNLLDEWSTQLAKLL